MENYKKMLTFAFENTRNRLKYVEKKERIAHLPRGGNTGCCSRRQGTCENR